MDLPLGWLLEGPGWIKYRTLVDLLGRGENEPEVTKARGEMISDPHVVRLVDELQGWPGYALQRHNDARHPLHKLVFLADLGLRATDPGLSRIVDGLLSQTSQEGVFQILINIPVRFGGSGEDEHAWMLCDAPLMIYSLAQFGLEDDPAVRKALGYLVDLVDDFGWPCAAASRFGSKFRGPGRRGDPCPYANLVMLKALSQFKELRDSQACRDGASALLRLWEDRGERRPYLFAMGTHFNRLKAPLIWYDVLHVLDVLSRFPFIAGDARLLEMAGLLLDRADDGERFTAESIWKAWGDWEFGQKKEPSRWITLICHRILSRLDLSEP